MQYSDTHAVIAAADAIRAALPKDAGDFDLDGLVDLAVRGLRARHGSQRGQAKAFGSADDRQKRAEAWQERLDRTYQTCIRNGFAYSHRATTERVGLTSDPPCHGSTVRRACRNPANKAGATPPPRHAGPPDGADVSGRQRPE